MKVCQVENRVDLVILELLVYQVKQIYLVRQVSMANSASLVFWDVFYDDDDGVSLDVVYRPPMAKGEHGLTELVKNKMRMVCRDVLECLVFQVHLEYRLCQ